MNKERRAKLGTAVSNLYDAIDNFNEGASVAVVLENLNTAEEITTTCCDEEDECMSVIPDNLQFTSRYESMEEAYNAMEEAIDSIQEAADIARSNTGDDGNFSFKGEGDGDEFVERIEEAISRIEDAQIA